MKNLSVSLLSELEVVAADVRSLRDGRTYLQLPEDLKTRLCRLWKSGVSAAQIRKETGVQAVSLKQWSEKLSAASQTTKKVSILKVVPSARSNRVTQTLKFQYAEGRVFVEVPIEALSQELLQRLTSC
jgi:hypothetical protein